MEEKKDENKPVFGQEKEKEEQIIPIEDGNFDDDKELVTLEDAVYKATMDYRDMTLAEIEQELGGFDYERMMEALHTHRRLRRGKTVENAKRLQEITLIIKKHEPMKMPMTPEKLRMILEDLGPTFVKMGQIFSKRTDILPPEYCKELEKLCEESAPLPLEEVEMVIEENLGRTIEDVFETFEEKPIGSASIGQVHFATLKSGQKVVVKVQRPGIEEMMKNDIQILKKLVKPLKLAPKVGDSLDFLAILDELWKISQEELNYLVEAVHTIHFRNLNADELGIGCPIIVKQLTTSRVMTMEYIDGCSIGDRDKLDALMYDRSQLGKRMIQNYIKQVLDDGFFHADPHQGNIMVRGEELIWIDMGMMGSLTKQERSTIKQGIRMFIKRDNQGLIRAITALGAMRGEVDQTKLYTDIDYLIDRYADQDLEDLNLGLVLTDIIRAMNENNVVLPPSISMVARGLIVIEGVLSELSPDTNVLQVAQTYMKKDYFKSKQYLKTMRQDAQNIVASGEKAIEIPGLVSDLLKSTMHGQTKVKLDLEGSKSLMEDFNRIMNNLIVCIITAALLLASSLICTTNMQPKILGIPALGFLGYTLAFALGIYLIVKSHIKSDK